MTHLLCRGSLKLAGFSVATYGSAEAFLENDDLERSGCIILDYQMPGLNGIEVQRLLFEQEIILPIIFLTAHAVNRHFFGRPFNRIGKFGRAPDAGRSRTRSAAGFRNASGFGVFRISFRRKDF
ncbi:response regulator [Parasutterella excrementihominis]|nr:response regulator [Parasutterella excrementihominis]MTT94265.1 response regulator [Parasutterella excrementihominis]